MKKTALILAAVLLLTGLSACSELKGEGTVYQVYFLSEDVSRTEALVSEPQIIPEGVNPIDYLLDALLRGPTRDNMLRIIPTSVTLRGWTFQDGLLTIDFSGRYSSLSGISLTLADYSVVRTLSQVEGVQAVEITAEGEAILYRDHQRLIPADICGGGF